MSFIFTQYSFCNSFIHGLISIYMSPSDVIFPLVHLTHPPDLSTRLVEPYKQGVVPDCTHGSSTRWRCSTRGSSMCGAFKTRSCFRLDLGVVLAWSLNYKELFKIGFVDCPQAFRHKAQLLMCLSQYYILGPDMVEMNTTHSL